MHIPCMQSLQRLSGPLGVLGSSGSDRIDVTASRPDPTPQALRRSTVLQDTAGFITSRVSLLWTSRVLAQCRLRSTH